MVKYGVVGALALAVLVAAMWDGSKKPSPETTGPVAEGTLGQARPKQEATLTPQPVAAKPEASKPIEEEFVQHTVQAKETLRTIARTWLKDESRWQELLEANKSRITDPHHLAKGLTLVFPKSKLEKKAEDEGGTSAVQGGFKKDEMKATEVPAGSERKYVVKEGDTLYAIAKRELGSGGRWKDIQKLNGLSSETLKKGQTLSLPSK
jgi:nucleoid-associated protein YgaU